MRHYYIAILLLLSCFAVEARLGAIDESPSRGLLNFATEYSPEDEDKGRDRSPSETSHSSHSDHDNEETDKEEPADGGEGDESDSSSGGGTTEATPSGEPVTSSGSGGGISAGAAAGIAVGGVVAAAAAFLAGRRTRTQSGTAGPTVAEPTVFRKPESGSTTSHAASNPDMGAPSSASTDMDVVESSSRMDRV